MKVNRKTGWAIALGLLLVSVLACGPAAETMTPTPTAASLPPEETGVAQVTPGSQITVTPAPPVTTEAGCTLNSAFAADVSIPDNTQLAPNTAFVKTWRLRNSGTCPWEAGTQLVYISGDAMGGPASVPVAAVAPGSTTDVSVNLIAPATPGTYRGNWQLQAPDGTRFGSVIYVQIVVPSPVTFTPTPVPITATPTPVPITLTPTPVPGGCVAVDPALEPILTQVEGLGYDLGCPTQPAFTIFGAFQEFWANVDNPNPHTHYRSLMIWRSDNREIYVIDGVDTNASEGMLLAYTDFWDESQPETPPACAAMTVPSGYQMPRRGFGRIWCTNSLWDPIGWPNVAEEAVSLRIQPMQTGLLLQVIRPAGGYLIALDYRAVYAITRMVAP